MNSTDSARVAIRVYDGPNRWAPFAAVVAEFRDPVPVPLPPERIEGQLRAFLNPQLMQRVRLPLPDGSFAAIAAAIGNALQDSFGPNGFEARAERTHDGGHRILLECVDPEPTRLALQASLDLTAALFTQASGQRFDAAGLSARLRQAAARIAVRQPDPLARALIRAARQRGIPVYSVAPGSRIWMYGQGSRGLHAFEVANHRDALTGSRLAKNKYHSNELVLRLGLPGVRHYIVATPEAARRAARELGYPLVVKPLDGGKGAGVTVHIDTEAELLKAYAAAERVTKSGDEGKVLVEKHVEGDDHRLVVLGGRLQWAVRRSPPAITGDGASTVTQLIDAENARRAASPIASIASALLTMDDEMRALLQVQGHSPQSVPAAGQVLRLRRIANIARGGTLTDCTADVHADNRAMAEALARSFHLDAIGIDFMTPDIGRSWRDVDCAVLEVNSTPGFSSDERAEQIIAGRFPDGATGRVPTILLLDLPTEATHQAVAHLSACGQCVGRADDGTATLAGLTRFGATARVAERARGLLLDSACDALVLATTFAELEAHGAPLDRFDLILAGPAPADQANLAPLLAGLANHVHWELAGADRARFDQLLRERFPQ